ncbi:MAG: hypothetical protein AVDCRST_MAG49-3356, partial [uncultured Thermomicrobiales bacterium]
VPTAAGLAAPIPGRRPATAAWAAFGSRGLRPRPLGPGRSGRAGGRHGNHDGPPSRGAHREDHL